jgi:hypothetical protein
MTGQFLDAKQTPHLARMRGQHAPAARQTIPDRARCGIGHFRMMDQICQNIQPISVDYSERQLWSLLDHRFFAAGCSDPKPDLSAMTR